MKDHFREQNSRGRLTAQREFSRQTATSFPGCNGLFCLAYRAPLAHRVSNRSASLIFTTGSQRTRPRSPATAINLFYFTMDDCESQTDGREATRLMVREEREGRKLLKRAEIC